MKILKNAGRFKVLTKSKDIITNIASAARTCYQSQDKASPENDIKLVKNLLSRGHEAMIEFADMTVQFNNLSRGFTHEMVRHRLCSFAQESTRYVDESDFNVVVPPHKNEHEDIDIFNKNGDMYSFMTFAEMLDQIEDMYRSLRKAGWKPEDARQILPTAIKAQIVVKANMREWRQILKMRCDIFAHWEIRAVMLDLLKWCQKNIPLIFDDFKFFTTPEGTEYARPVLSSHRLATYIEEYSKHNDLDELVAKMDDETAFKLFIKIKELKKIEIV